MMPKSVAPPQQHHRLPKRSKLGSRSHAKSPHNAHHGPNPTGTSLPIPYKPRAALFATACSTCAFSQAFNIATSAARCDASRFDSCFCDSSFSGLVPI